MLCKCCHTESKYIDSINKLDFDGSIFNHISDVYLCQNCGFLETKAPYKDEDISKHYQDHVLYHSMSGVGVGGSSKADLYRYQKYKDFLGDSNGTLVDVGCSKGGFLNWLNTNNNYYKKLIGIDIDKMSLNKTIGLNCEFKFGDAFKLPVDQNSIDTLTYFHVWEHVNDIDKLITEALRVLKNNGNLIIEVPNLDHYWNQKSYVGIGFWLYMQEHLNHFSISSIYNLITRHGLKITKYEEQVMPINDDFFYPSLLLKINKIESNLLNKTLSPKKNTDIIKKLVENELQNSKNIANFITELPKPISFWGIGLEFFSVFSKMSNYNFNEVKLYDKNKSKQNCKFKGVKIIEPELDLKSKSLLITSYLSYKEILNEAINIGWKKKNIFLLNNYDVKTNKISNYV